MKTPTLTANVRSVSFWYKFGIVGLAILSIYFIRGKFIQAFDYPFLTDQNTIKFFRNSKMIVIVQNDPNLETKIKRIYKSMALFCKAANKSELVPEVQAFCAEEKNIIVVSKNTLCEETEKCLEESLDPLPDLAEQFKYAIYITEPSKRLMPIYAGWLLNENDSHKLLTTGKVFLEDLLKTVPQFSESFKNFSGQTIIEDMLKYYKLAASNANGMLHCTARYLGTRTVPGSFEYWNKREVKRNLGRSYDLDVIGFVWTPRTFGARVKLNKEQLLLWGNDEDNIAYPRVADEEVQEKKANFSPVKGRGSRAHITVGVANGVQAVVTGKDLQEIVRLEAVPKNWPTYTCEEGWLRDYGGGKWVLYSDKGTTLATMFGGVYRL